MSTLIIEGPDGSGKSALIRRIMRTIPVAHIVHHGAYPKEDDIYVRYLQPMLEALRTPYPEGYALVADRSWLAEPIYGEVMRGGMNRVMTWQRDVLDAMFANTGGTIVLCLPPVNICVENWAVRREREYPDAEEKVKALWAGYSAAVEKWIARGLRVIVYDYTQDYSAGAVMRQLLILRNGNA